MTLMQVSRQLSVLRVMEGRCRSLDPQEKYEKCKKKGIVEMQEPN